MCCVVQLDQQEDDFVDNGDAEISREIVFRLVMACNDAGREEIEVGNLRELCEQSGVPLGATSGILELILPPDDTSGRLPWKHFVVALCAQVGGVEDMTGFVRLLLDPGMFGNDEGQISKTDFITLIDWWSSIDTSISAELKSALFTALNPTEEEVCFCVYPCVCCLLATYEAPKADTCKERVIAKICSSYSIVNLSRCHSNGAGGTE